MQIEFILHSWNIQLKKYLHGQQNKMRTNTQLPHHTHWMRSIAVYICLMSSSSFSCSLHNIALHVLTHSIICFTVCNTHYVCVCMWFLCIFSWHNAYIFIFMLMIMMIVSFHPIQLVFMPCQCVCSYYSYSCCYASHSHKRHNTQQNNNHGKFPYHVNEMKLNDFVGAFVKILHMYGNFIHAWNIYWILHTRFFSSSSLERECILQEQFWRKSSHWLSVNIGGDISSSSSSNISSNNIIQEEKNAESRTLRKIETCLPKKRELNFSLVREKKSKPKKAPHTCIREQKKETSPMTCNSINLIFLKAATATVMARRESLNWFVLNHTNTYGKVYISYDTAHSKYLSHHVNVIYVQPQSRKKDRPNSNSIGFSNNFRFADKIKYIYKFPVCARAFFCVSLLWNRTPTEKQRLNNVFLIHTQAAQEKCDYFHYQIIWISFRSDKETNVRRHGIFVALSGCVFLLVSRNGRLKLYQFYIKKKCENLFSANDSRIVLLTKIERDNNKTHSPVNSLRRMMLLLLFLQWRFLPPRLSTKWPFGSHI